MKNFKFYFSFISIIFVLLPLHAKKVELEKAESVAQNCVQSKQKFRAANDIRLKYAATNRNRQGNAFRAQDASVQDTVYYYVFDVNESAGGGFVIVAGDDAVRPVLGYSDKGSYDENNLPPNFAWWMDELQQQIAYAQTHNLPQSKAVGDEWDSYLKGNISSSTSSAGPLIQTQWDQGTPYNNLCPVAPDGYRCPTGCVITAMAQIMKYYNFPEQGGGQSQAYITTTLRISVPSIDFSATTYDWTNMLNTYTYNGNETPQQQNAVATLMYHCGVSLKTNYTPDDSGASDTDVPIALTTYFGYSKNMQQKIRLDYDDIVWEDMLKAQIDAGFPVLYGGNGYSGGHAFICDGYDNTNKFHFNWGWGGSSDGYYVTTALNPSYNYSFNDGQSMIIGIKPALDRLTGLNVNAGTLSPAFRPYIFNYTVQVDASVESIDITGITDISGTTVTGNVTNLPLKINDYTDVKITVANENGDSQTYTISVVRGIAPPSFTWEVYNAAQITKFKLGVASGKLCTIDWGDGSPQMTIIGNGGIYDYELAYLSHTYDASGVYHVIIRDTDDEDSPILALLQNENETEQDFYRITQINLHAASLLSRLSIKYAENTDLDVSQNKQLSYLKWEYGKLTNLNLSNNMALTHLYCFKNQLTNLDVSNDTVLTVLYCPSNQLTNLDISSCKALTDLYCYENQLTNLNLSNNMALTHLECYDNQLTKLDISNNTGLKNLNCSSNKLANLDVSTNTELWDLACNDNYLTDLNVSNNNGLIFLSCDHNHLVDLNVNNNTELTFLSCYNNQLAVLNINNTLKLECLDCGKNQLTNLDISNNKALDHLYCNLNQLAKLNINNNTALVYLFCDHNKLTQLDVSNNTALTWLQCYNNQLIGLDVSNNSALEYVLCKDNAISLADLYAISQRNIVYKDLGWQYLPDSTVLLNTPIAIDTVFHGVNTVFDVSGGMLGTNYLLNNGEITFLTTGNYTVIISNPAITTNVSYLAFVRQTFTVTDGTGIHVIPQVKPLNVWVQDGTLHVSGLAVGNAWAVYDISGKTVYRNIAESEEASVSLPVRGVYFVHSGKETIKAAY